MDRDELADIGRRLAARHRDGSGAEARPESSLMEYAESARTGGWSMRSALTRFAQPEAVRSSEVYQLIRRLDAALHGFGTELRRHVVICDRALALEVGSRPVAPYPDTRTADLARMMRLEAKGFPEILAGYAELDPLVDEERQALPLLRIALALDDLAETLAEWASRGPADPPVAEVDAACVAVRGELDDLGVPVEQRPPARGR